LGFPHFQLSGFDRYRYLHWHAHLWYVQFSCLSDLLVCITVESHNCQKIRNIESFSGSTSAGPGYGASGLPQ
jgi:hypothetical protein